MEAVEIVVYILVAITIGGLVLLVTMELASPQVYERLKDSFSQEDEVGFAIVNEDDISSYLFSVWEECNFGVNAMNVTFEYEGDQYTKEMLFEEVKASRLCNTLSSTEYECGNREDVSMEPLEEGIHTAACSRADGTGSLVIQ